MARLGVRAVQDRAVHLPMGGGVRPLSDFAPVLPGETAVTVVAVIGMLVAFAFLARVYRHGPVWVAVASVLISWVPVQLLAWWLEGRRMWLPGQHSAVFFWGDLVALPAVAVAFSVMRRRWAAEHGGERPLAEDRRWLVAVAVCAVLVSYAYHSGEIGSWRWDALHAPSKAWHDYFVYPVFLFFLASPLPYLWQTSWRRAPLAMASLTAVAFAGVAAWYLLGHVYDPSQAATQVPLLRFA